MIPVSLSTPKLSENTFKPGPPSTHTKISDMPFLTCTLPSSLYRIIRGIHSSFSRLFNHQSPPPAPDPSPDLENSSSTQNPDTPRINTIQPQIQTRIPTQTLLTIPETTFTIPKTKLISPRTEWRNTCFEEAYEEQMEQSRRLGEMLLEARE